MPVAEASPVASSEPGFVKMEDRKRAATSDHNDSAPPLKKQATSVNGGSKPHPDADMPWKDDLEVSLGLAGVFQKLIDEVKLLLGAAEDIKGDRPTFQSSLSFDDVDNFEKHLKSRSNDIRDIISRLVKNTPKSPPEICELQSQLAKKLAEEKATIAELDKALSEKQQLEESLEEASLRYMVAEKKLDRARSLTVAKLEKQYILGPQRPGGDSASGQREEQSVSNGATPSAERGPELDEAHNKLVAISEKQKEQLQKLETENANLLSQITDLNIKATNVQLREEAVKLRSERTAYRNQVDEETQNVIAEKEAQLIRAETDLARIRNARDELLADQQMRKAAQEQEKTAVLKVQELAEARNAQIASLESEVERLRLQVENAKATQADSSDIPVEELRGKYQVLERQYAMLNTELTSMQTACKKYSTLASQKVTDFSALEEKMARLTAEKSKADQKYFAAMKSKEARDLEVRTLRMQNSKSSDIVSQLKESEAATRSLLANMEKQVSETKEALNSMMNKHHATQQQLAENGIVIEGLKGQINELKTLSTSKDATLASTSSACRQAETEIEGLKATLADTKKSLDNWKNKSLGNSSSEYEMLRVKLPCFPTCLQDITADSNIRH
ncbi:unnamed protein product [Aspergillus oryzae]|nr:unnamed protein product [Aspergillus oryzae]GMF91224.1 unnamed protein product [Aspergillus oryzae]